MPADQAAVSRVPTAFVSHSSLDKDRFVIPFARDLRSNGVDAWVDQWSMLAGDSLMDRIFEQGIGNTEAFVLIFSKNSAESEWVKKELDAAGVRRISKNTRIVVIRIDDTPLPVALEGLLWIEADPDEDWSSALEQTLRAIFEVPDSPEIGPAPLFVTNRHAIAPSAPTNLPSASSAQERVAALIADPSARVALHQVVKSASDSTVVELSRDRYPWSTDRVDGDAIENRLESFNQTVDGLGRALATGVFFGTDDQDALWRGVLMRMVDSAVADPFTGSFQEVWSSAALYPALRLAYIAGVSAVAGSREHVLPGLLSVPVADRYANGPNPLIAAVTPDRVLKQDLANLMPRWGDSNYYEPMSRYLKQSIEPVLLELVSTVEFERHFNRFEALRSLLEFHSTQHWCSLGEYAWAIRHGRSNLLAEINLEIEREGSSWPLVRGGAFDGSPEKALEAVAGVSEAISKSRYW